ncbi:response regulator transcription factor [Fredinandcohnia onubensis]|uniref:response regulator transcription factor n=1 Tax=Fredinandcohnia onubensis TaxID=1571209 RepID=UPI0015D4F3F3|nr:response regulator transcription factor [Fredinandcohnia onubensis]
MSVYIIDRDFEEANGLKWFLQSYLVSGAEVTIFTSLKQLQAIYDQKQPDIIMVEIELVQDMNDIHFLKSVKNEGSLTFGITAEPLFKNALKAIQMQVAHLFVKPIDLNQLKISIHSHSDVITNKKVSPEQKELDNEFYLRLFLNPEELIEESQLFFLIEPESPEDVINLYNWLNGTPLFENVNYYPLTKQIICISGVKDLTQFNKKARALIREWHLIGDHPINIAVYDGPPVSLWETYQETLNSLNQRFYKGFEHVFYTSKRLVFQQLDPLLTPEEQKLWIEGLENEDIPKIKEFLYQLCVDGIYYDQDSIRIHLTSVLAQIRRYMLKYNLHQRAFIEENYRRLFNIILDAPILYTIIQEMILFTQTLMKNVTDTKYELKANYAELAADVIGQEYRNTKLSLTDVANIIGITPNYLSIIFSKHHGVPFKKYLQQYRIQQAQKMLLKTDFTINEVAQMNGFEDPNYFSKVFKLHTNLSPYRYQKLYRNEEAAKPFL